MRKVSCNRKICKLGSAMENKDTTSQTGSGSGAGFSGINPMVFNYTIPINKKVGKSNSRKKRSPKNKKRVVQSGMGRRKRKRSTKKRKRTMKGGGRKKSRKRNQVGGRRRKRSVIKKRSSKKVCKIQKPFKRW